MGNHVPRKSLEQQIQSCRSGARDAFREATLANDLHTGKVLVPRRGSAVFGAGLSQTRSVARRRAQRAADAGEAQAKPQNPR